MGGAVRKGGEMGNPVTIEEFREEFVGLSILENLREEVSDLLVKTATERGEELDALLKKEMERSMDWLVVIEDGSGESRYPCYYADSALTIYDEYKPERIYQRTGKRAVARLVHKGVTIAIKHANDTGYISRVMREGYGLKY